MRDVLLGPMSPSDATGPSSVLAVEKEISTVPNEAPGGVAPVDEVLDQKDTLRLLPFLVGTMRFWTRKIPCVCSPS